MKIRIKGNTIRFRLAKSEVHALAQHGKLEEKTEFPTCTLVYAVERTLNSNLSADCSQNTITLYVPDTELQQWAVSDQVGLSYDMPLPHNGVLSLLLEKDFKCMDAAETEDQSDFYENPHITC